MLEKLHAEDASILPKSWTTPLPSRTDSAKQLAGQLLPRRVAAIVIALLVVLYAFGNWWYPQLRRLPYRHLTINVPADCINIDQRANPVRFDAAFTTTVDAATAVDFFNRNMNTREWTENGWSGQMQDLGIGAGFTHVRGEYSASVTEDWLEQFTKHRFTAFRWTHRQSVLVKYWPAGTTDPDLATEHGQKAAMAARSGKAVITVTVSGSLTRITDFEYGEAESESKFQSRRGGRPTYGRQSILAVDSHCGVV